MRQETLLCVNQTKRSSSVSSMSIVIMYEDSSGTAALNTDLVAQVSANSGTDFTTSYTCTGCTKSFASDNKSNAKCDAVSVTGWNSTKI